MRNLSAGLALSALLCAPAWAGKPVPDVERKVVGDAIQWRLVPSLETASRTSDGRQLWTERISQPGASFLKLHLADVNLAPGDQLTLINARGRVIEQITRRGPKQRGTFWALSGQGDSVVLQFEFAQTYRSAPFRVDKVIVGNDALLAPGGDSGARSICSPADFEDSICFEADAGKWTNARASVGVMSVGGNANSALFCSGSNVSGSNAILTNQHCVENQAECDNTEFVFDAYTTQCGVSSAPLAEWTSYRCDEVLASEPFVNCDAGPGDLDFTLASVIGDPASVHGFVPVSTTPVTSGEELYIVQHPAGRPQEIAVGSGADVEVDGSVLRYYGTLDTEGGSSGSPVFRASDNTLVGLHHCGGCSTPGVGNRGMLMSDIAPLIQPFLCTAGAPDLRATGASVPVEVTGNGNAVLDPGERWGFTVSVLNNACDLAASDVAVEVAIGSGNATLVASTATLGSIAAGASATSVPFEFDVPTDALCGDTISFDIVQVTSGDNSFAGATNVASIVSGDSAPTLIASEDFNNGLIQWTIDDGGTGTGPAATWTLDNPGNRSLTLSAPFVIVDSDELGTGQSMDEILTSPAYDVTGFQSVSLEFMHDFNWYSGGQNERGDVEVSSAATAGAWVNVASYQGGDTSGAVQIDVTPYAADDLQVRFHYSNAVYEWWWAIDDIALLGTQPNECSVFTGNDSDGDGVADDVDNCTLVVNADQVDADADGYGNACDADLNNDGIINVVDLGILRTVFFTADPVADFNVDGVVNAVDLGLMRLQFFGPPGPSANAP